MSQRAVFLDRDGVINETVQRDGQAVSPRELEEFRLMPDVVEAARRLRAGGFRLFVVTNQPDIARGRLAPAVLEEHMKLTSAAVQCDAVRVCPHDDADDCACRKPRPGMLLDLAHEWRLDLARSYMIGDSWRDMAAGRAAGCTTILVQRPYNVGVNADVHVDSLMETAEVILNRAENAST